MSDLSILIVNTQSRDLLLRGLDAVQRELATGDWDAEVIVLDNASTDGSAAAAEAHPLHPEVLALDQRQGKAASDRQLLERASGRYGLLLNEDAELQPGALATMVAALDEHPRAAAVGAKLLRPDGTPQASAWAFPSVAGAAWAAIGRPGRMVQSTGDMLREVDWAQSAALLVRVEAARAIDTFDPAFFVYSDEVDFERRLRDAGHTVLWSPQAQVVHHEQLSTDLARGAAAHRRVPPRARPLPAQAPLAPGPLHDHGAHGVDLPRARSRRDRAARPRCRPLPRACPRRRLPSSGRGAAGGRGRVQRAPPLAHPARTGERRTAAQRRILTVAVAATFAASTGCARPVSLTVIFLRPAFARRRFPFALSLIDTPRLFAPAFVVLRRPVPIATFFRPTLAVSLTTHTFTASELSLHITASLFFVTLPFRLTRSVSFGAMAPVSTVLVPVAPAGSVPVEGLDGSPVR
ncbi:MAG: glycosyltransferase family 2 protein [Patulibacter minatonensis]